MKVLVLAQEIGGNAPGILYERLLSAMSSLCQLDIATCSYRPSVPIRTGRVFQMKYPRMKHWAKRWLFSWTGKDWISCHLAHRLQNRLEGEYDVILSLCSNDRFWALEAGAYLHQRHGWPWACYCVDAIPAPAAWVGNGPYRKAALRLWTRIGGGIGFLASICDEMLAYQRSMLRQAAAIPTGVYLPPVSGLPVDTTPFPGPDPVFLYAGRIYGKRTAKYLLEAFGRFLGDRPRAELVFLCPAADAERVLSGIPEHVAGHVRLEPWTDDVQPWIDRASALIDLDADVPDDIYLSSKMFTYLLQKRPIICETGTNSPSRHLFRGIPSIIQCDHDPEQLYRAMHKAMDGFQECGYTDRLGVIRQSQESPVRLYQDLEKFARHA